VQTWLANYPYISVVKLAAASARVRSPFVYLQEKRIICKAVIGAINAAYVRLTYKLPTV